jgi:hypothetical protein
MGHKSIQSLFSTLMIVSMVSCSSASSPPLGSAGATPPPNAPAVEPHHTENGTRQWSTTPLTQNQPSGTPEQLDPALQQVITQAREDLARRLGVPIDSVTVAAVIGQEFSTDAFYCRTSKDRIARDESPQVVSGQSILLSASAHRYEYHASGRTVVFCRPLP